MPDYLVLGDSPHSQDAWTATQDAQGRTLRPARPAREEQVITLRLGRQFTARLRLPRSGTTGADRQANIAKAARLVRLGEEIASGVQVIEYEVRFTEAREALVGAEERDAQGGVVRGASYAPPVEESLSHAFTLRVDGADIVKRELTDEEFQQRDWPLVLASRVPPRSETWRSSP